VEEKKLSKEDEKILGIEEAYIDLIKAYSSCLTALKVKTYYRNVKERFKAMFSLKPKWSSTEAKLLGNILAPRLTKWRIRRQVDLLRAAFLLLISQNRNKIDSKIIKQFELYCEDMTKLSAQFEKSGLIAIFYAAIPAITGVTALVVATKPTSSELSFVPVFFISITIFYLVYFFVFFLIAGFMGSKRIFRDAEVPEKENRIFSLLDELSKI
jgi:hypothetical protein